MGSAFQDAAECLEMVTAMSPHALPKLEVLNIRGCNVGPEGGIALAEACRRGCMPKLRKLHLNENEVGDV